MRLKLSITVICAIVVCGCGNRAVDEGVREVPVMVVSRTDSVTIAERYPAIVEGRQDVDIFPQISGTITRVCVREGQCVDEGQILFIIDQAPYRAAVRMAAANVRVAESNVATARLERDSKQALYDGQVVSEYELLTAQNTLASCEAALEQAQAALADANNNLSYTEVRSPVNGVVGALPYRAGSLVSPQIDRPLTSVSDNAEMWVYFALSEKELRALMRQHGSMSGILTAFAPVTLIMADGCEYGNAGHVETIGGVVNSQTGTVQIKAVFPNADRQLMSGSAGTIVMPYSDTDVILISKNATYEIQDKIFAYRVNAGKVESVEITVAQINDGNSYIVRSGLAVGDTIVTEGVGTLRDGQHIRTRRVR